MVNLYILPVGNPIQNEETGLVEFWLTGPLQYMAWYHAVGLIWISEFILACQQMTVAGAVVTYYFTRWGGSDMQGRGLCSQRLRCVLFSANANSLLCAFHGHGLGTR